jgi:hypothetical protein
VKRRLVDQIRSGGRQSGGAPIEDTRLRPERDDSGTTDAELPNLPSAAASRGWGERPGG